MLELLRLQNSLNFQEEKDKASISLLGATDNDKVLADIGSVTDEKGKSYMRAPDKSGLAYGADLLGSGLARVEDNAHVEIEKRCQVCNQDNNSRHYVNKAMKIACLKYKSAPVSHYGKTYDRMKLIKIQEDLVQQHCLQLRAIEGGKNAMEKSRDILNDGNVKNYDMRLQDYGISFEQGEDPAEIGRKILEKRDVHVGMDEVEMDSDGSL